MVRRHTEGENPQAEFWGAVCALPDDLPDYRWSLHFIETHFNADRRRSLLLTAGKSGQGSARVERRAGAAALKAQTRPGRRWQRPGFSPISHVLGDANSR